MKPYCFLIVALLVAKIAQPQNNLIHNPGFEEGDYNNVNCDYYSTINADLDNWYAILLAQDQSQMGTWIDLTNTQCASNRYPGACEAVGYIPSNTQNLPSKKLILLKSDNQQNNNYDIIGQQLKETLTPNQQYILRFKAAPLKKDVFSNLDNNIRIHFSEKGNQQWDDGQVLIDATTYGLDLGENDFCQWTIVQKSIFIPPNLDKLDNIILEMQSGAFALDDFELYQTCDNTILIEKRVFDGYFYNPPINDGLKIEYYASNELVAGFDVKPNHPNGAVIFENNAEVDLIAGNKLVGKPGFHAKPGSKVHAYLAPCQVSQKTSWQPEDETNSNQSEPETDSDFRQGDNMEKCKFKLYPNPNNGSFTVEAAGLSSIQVYNLLGELVQQFQVSGSRLDVDIKQYGNGIYLVKATSQTKSGGGQVFTEKVVVE